MKIDWRPWMVASKLKLVAGVKSHKTIIRKRKYIKTFDEYTHGPTL